MGCVVYIIKANTVIDCKDREACHMYTDDNLTLEEADNRIICHIGHMIKADNLISIKARSADTDVIVILLEFMPQLRKGNFYQLISDWGRHYALTFPSFTLSVDVTLLHTSSTTQKKQLYAIWMSCPIHEEVIWMFQLLS